MSLRDYDRKRRFGETPEPASSAPTKRGRGHRPIFVVQLHNARARHYDFRLEVDGALKSWAVPKGPSLRPGEKRLAVEVEDHPLSYAGFEGEIPAGNYGAGHVLVFDRGTWASDGDPLEGIAAGKLDFVLEGGKLRGGWKLVRTGGSGRRSGGKPQWLLIKRDDAHAADTEADALVEAEPGPATSAAVRGGKKATPPRRKAAPRKADARWRTRAKALKGAKDGAMPVGFAPELAQARASAPTGDDWLHEVKWDGYRMLVDLVSGKARLRSRNGLDWTSDFPAIAAAIEALPVSDACLDGELVALGDGGYSDFALLQKALKGRSASALRYAIFDMPGLAGVDLTATALLERKTLLETLLDGVAPELFYSTHMQGHGPQVFAAAEKQGFEGIISKRSDARYTQARSGHWLKIKGVQEDDFLIVGYSAPKGTRSGFGALLLASREPDGGLRYMGRVGTGFTAEKLRQVHRAMQPLRRKGATLALPDHLPHDKRDRGDIAWLEPQLVAEIAYRGLGSDGLLRHASFQRLRTDKPAKEVAMPTAPPVAKPAGSTRPGKTARTAGIAISSRDREVFPGTGITKGEVADYYAAIANWILPWVANRPLSLVRCPQGASGQCFFQKHHAGTLGEHVRALPIRDKSGSEDYLAIDDAAGLLELVQMNVLEFHPWGARADAPEKPDLLVFDLDPDEGVGWKEVVAAAREVRDRLADAGLDSRVRLSGGKGLHVVVPIERGPGWDEVRAFCSAFAEALAAHQPLRFVATMSKAKRKDRIFIDWLRNARGATSVCNWSLRARPGAPVAMPLRWEELGRIQRADAYDLRKALRRAASLGGDPWELEKVRQRLPA